MVDALSAWRGQDGPPIVTAPAPIMSGTVRREATVAVAASKPFVKLLTSAVGPSAVAQRNQWLSTLLPQYGLSIEALTGEDARVPHSLSLELLTRSSWLLGSSAIGLEAMKVWSLGDQGIGDYLNATCATVSDFLQTITEHVALLNDGIHFTLENDGETARFVYELDPMLTADPWLAEISLGKVIVELRRAFSGRPDAAPSAVRFTHHAPDYERDYAAVFGARVEFGDDRDLLEFPASLLSTPIPTADPVLHTLLRRQAAAMLRARPQRPTLLERVRVAVCDELGRGGADQGSVARRVGMSVATLRRKLEQEHGTCYSDVVDDLKRQRACEQLTACSLTIDEIAFQAGFSQTTAFYRAFKRWFGCTPAEYRRAHARMR